MFRTRTLRAPLAALIALAACVWLPSASVTSPPKVSGVAAGVWQLPPSLTTPGFVSGVLANSSGVPAYRLDGVVDEVSSPCLSCREGTVSGILHEVGSGLPDYLVAGDWHVGQLSGQGEVEATIYKVIGPGLFAIGRIDAAVDDPPSQPDVPGKFIGRWLLRR